VDERPRRLEQIIEEALRAFRVVVVTGPRQAGKTTLVQRTLAGGGSFARLDDETTMQAALADPVGFATFGDTPRAFDEIQRGGDPLVRAIKAVVDQSKRPGQFLLNGSADFLTVPTISESLAGRAALFELWPFTQGELDGTPDGFLATAFGSPDVLADAEPSDLTTAHYLERVCAGGFPEALSIPTRSRRTWFRNYIRTVTERDITELTGARRSQQLPRILSLLAARTANELVVAHVHDASGLGSRATTEDYIAYLQMTYLAMTQPAWSRNLTRKITRHPKIHLTDTGLAAHILGKDPAALARPTDPARGPLLETFVFNEIHRQTTWVDDEIRLHHLRDRDGAEIDIVAESTDGRIVAIEVKSAPTATATDARWLAWLRDKTGKAFTAGIVLHTGPRPYRLGDRLYAIPISHIWNTA
jgi:predicted AAA+ superfamily ATPase